jgi:cell wall-associated NlpC family hydrolase
VTSGLLAAALVVAAPASASGDPGLPLPPANPSDGQIADANGRVTSQLGQVGRLINQLGSVDQQLQQLDDDVETKREAVNKALVDLQGARGAVAAADQRVDATKQGLADAGADIGRARRGFDHDVAELYMHGGGELSTLSSLTDGDAEELLDRTELLDETGRADRKTLDGLERAQVEKANRNSAARAAAQAAAAAAAAAQDKKTAAEQSVAAAEQDMDRAASRKADLDKQRDAAQAQLDAARAAVAGLRGQRAAFIAWDTEQQQEQAARAALIKAASQAALAAVQRVAGDRAARDRAAALAGGQSAHSAVDGDGDQAAVPGSPPARQWLMPPLTGDAAIETVVDRAMSQMGVTYAWGGGDENGPTLGVHDFGVADRYRDYRKIGFDCSGLMVYAFAGAGISLPHYSGYQYNAGVKMPLADRRRGDMLFWGRHGSRHVALYLGDDMMIEAPESGEAVRVVPVRFDGIAPYVVRMIDS